MTLSPSQIEFIRLLVQRQTLWSLRRSGLDPHQVGAAEAYCERRLDCVSHRVIEEMAGQERMQ